MTQRPAFPKKNILIIHDLPEDNMVRTMWNASSNATFISMGPDYVIGMTQDQAMKLQYDAAMILLPKLESLPEEQLDKQLRRARAAYDQLPEGTKVVVASGDEKTPQQLRERFDGTSVKFTYANNVASTLYALTGPPADMLTEASAEPHTRAAGQLR